LGGQAAGRGGELPIQKGHRATEPLKKQEEGGEESSTYNPRTPKVGEGNRDMGGGETKDEKKRTQEKRSQVRERTGGDPKGPGAAGKEKTLFKWRK